jgi:signal transduction histidine kinase
VNTTGRGDDLKIDVQTIFWVDAFLYLMLHVALWYGLARFRSRVAVLWSVSGILSALSLFVLGSKGLIATDQVVVWGQLLMGLGNWGRQIALRSIDGPADSDWLWVSGLLNLAFLALSYGLHFSGVPESTLMVLFYAFYALNCLEYYASGHRMAQSHDSIGATSIRWAGLVLSGSLCIKAVAMMTGHGSYDLYEASWDHMVVFSGQFTGIILLTVGFMQLFIDKEHRNQIATQEQLAREQEHTALAEQHSQALATLLAEREEIIRQLTLSNKSAGMGALVASFAHELNQPLAATMLHAELIQSQIKNAHEDQRQIDFPLIDTVAGHIVSDTQRAGDIIRKLRNLFRMSRGEFTKIEFKPLVLDVIDIVRAKMVEPKIHLFVGFDDGFSLVGDATQLQQVVLNLLNNAIDSLREIQHRERILQVRGIVGNGFLELEIEDNGSGIPAEKQNEVFSLFKSNKSDGMGVGLWLSQSIVESHGGTLTFFSYPGQGSVFTLRLPSTEYVLND